MKKFLLLALVIITTSCLGGFVIADNTSSGLRDSEKAFLKKLQEKKQSTNNKNPVKDEKKYQYVKEEEKENTQCQTALTKIDKLSLEVNDLKTEPSVQFNNTELKIKSLESQIARYKTQAKQFCSKELLKQSIYMKNY